MKTLRSVLGSYVESRETGLTHYSSERCTVESRDDSLSDNGRVFSWDLRRSWCLDPTPPTQPQKKTPHIYKLDHQFGELLSRSKRG